MKEYLATSRSGLIMLVVLPVTFILSVFYRDWETDRKSVV